MITLRLDPLLEQAINNTAKNLGLSKSEFIRNSIVDYLGKLDFFPRQFRPKRDCDSLMLTRAEELFGVLWKGRPNRYQHRGHFRLDKATDAQLSSNRGAVGNCLGLTILYNCLLKRMGIEAEALHLENAFGIGPHVLTILKNGDLIIDVENILPNGFDYKGHKQNPFRMKWKNKE